MFKRCVLSWIILSTFVLYGMGGELVYGEFSGSSRIDMNAFPIPCTLVAEIKLDSPCERTLLKFDIESVSAFNITLSGMVLKINSAVGITGPEHLILRTDFNLGALKMKDEFWFATPFETVQDVNLMSNVVVIPPGKLLFVKKRLTSELDIAGIHLTNLAMIEDVTFPNPGSAYGDSDCDGDGVKEGTCVRGVETNTALQYQTQSFAFGDILTIQGETVSGISVTTQIGICGTLGSRPVKKFSASGKVNEHCFESPKPGLFFDFQNVSISGITIGDFSIGQTINFNVLAKPRFSARTSVSFPLLSFATFSTSFSTSPTLNLGALSIKLATELLNINISLSDKLELKSTTASVRSSLDVGGFTASFSGNLSIGAGQGLRSLSLGLAMTQGTFTANHNVSFSASGDKGLTFSSLSMQLSIKNLTFAPVSITLDTAFGPAGLSKFSLSSGVVF